MSTLINALKSGRGWRRLGVVISVIWITVVASLVVFERVDTTASPDFWNIKTQRLLPDSVRQRLDSLSILERFIDPAWSEAPVSREWSLRGGKVLWEAFGKVAVGWLVAVVLIFTARWVAMGFSDPSKSGE